MKNINIIIAALIVLGLQYGAANAEVNFVDGDSASEFNFGSIFDSLEVPPTNGEPGEFEILACATQTNGANFFIGAEPNWNNLDLGECGGGAPGCIMGIFTKLAPEPNNAFSNCFWEQTTNGGTGVVLRYGGVRNNEPIADFRCNTGVGASARTPEIDAPPGSMVVRMYGARGIFLNPFGLPGSPEFGQLFAEAAFISSMFMYGEPFPEGGTAEEVIIQYAEVNTNWRACAMSLAMEGTPPSRAIPTMNEWGMIVFVIFAGAAAIFVLRRKSQAV